MAFREDALLSVERLADYLARSQAGEGRVIRQQPIAAVIDQLELQRFATHGGLEGDELGRFLDRYLANTTRLHHPAYMAHQVAVPHPNGSLGAMVDGLTNNAMAIYEMGPGAASIEYFVINWLLSKIGWTPSPNELQAHHATEEYSAGVLTHGGSLANLTAMLMARDKVAPESWVDGTPGDLVVLAGPAAHYSLARSVSILGLGQKALVALETDADGRVLPGVLEKVYEKVVADGRRVMAVVASACQTAAGLYDPLESMGQFCRQHGLWLHVDGAHGASALLSPRLASRLKGIELADSVTWDAHKMLRAPVLCAALLAKDHKAMDGLFNQEASYLFHQKEEPGFDFAHRTIECTKAGLGLRFFLALGAMGEAGLAAYVERQYDLALEAWEFLGTRPRIQRGPRPESNILCFRLDGPDPQQLAIRDQMNRDGSFYVSSTLLRGQRYLRLALMNPDTEMRDIRQLVEEVERIAGI